MSALTITDVTKSFASTPVLRGASLEVREGELAAVLGPSGCGKTTLLRIVAGFERADSGSVRVGDREVVSLPPERRRIGVVPQEAALFPHLSVARNVGFGLPRGSAARVAECLELVGLGGFGDRMPHELSGGQQQRVALARALAPHPGVVLLDEPFNALDRSLRGTVRDDVREALKRVGATAVLVTHDQEEALSMADTVAVMREGRIVQDGPPAAVYAAPCDLGVATFVGEAVVLPASSSHGVATCALGDLPQRSNGVSGPGRVALRPEQFVLTPPGTAGAPRTGGAGGAETTAESGTGAGTDAGGGAESRTGAGGGTGVEGTVERVEFFGHDAAVTVHLATGIIIRARTRGDVPHRPGDRVAVTVEGPVLFFPGG
jgi:iron(III) transport system ATP-binding protein